MRTIFAGSVCQLVAMVGFLATQSEAGLFTVSAVFGLGFSGIIPAYVLAVRELFPASEASWRVPTLLLFSGSGMAFGGWLAGAIYDYAGFYAIAFAAGILFNLVHLALISVLVWRQRSWCPGLTPGYASSDNVLPRARSLFRTAPAAAATRSRRLPAQYAVARRANLVASTAVDHP